MAAFVGVIVLPLCVCVCACVHHVILDSMGHVFMRGFAIASPDKRSFIMSKKLECSSSFFFSPPPPPSPPLHFSPYSPYFPFSSSFSTAAGLHPGMVDSTEVEEDCPTVSGLPICCYREEKKPGTLCENAYGG